MVSRGVGVVGIVDGVSEANFAVGELVTVLQ